MNQTPFTTSEEGGAMALLMLNLISQLMSEGSLSSSAACAIFSDTAQDLRAAALEAEDPANAEQGALLCDSLLAFLEALHAQR